MACSWREISAKISPKRRPADKKDQKKKKPQLPVTIFYMIILHPMLEFQGGIVKLPLKKFQLRKERKKKSP